MYLAAYNHGFKRALSEGGYGSLLEFTKQAADFAEAFSQFGADDIADLYKDLSPEEQKLFVSNLEKNVPDPAKRQAVAAKLGIQPATAPASAPAAKPAPAPAAKTPAKAPQAEKGVVTIKQPQQGTAPKKPMAKDEMSKAIQSIEPHESGIFSKIKSVFSPGPETAPLAEQMGRDSGAVTPDVQEFVRPAQGGYEVKRFDVRPESRGMQSVHVSVPDSIYETPDAATRILRSRRQHIPLWAGGGMLVGGGLGAGIGAMTGEEHEDPAERAAVGGTIGLGVGGLLGGIAGDRRGNALGKAMIAGRHIDQQAAAAFGRAVGRK